MIHIMLNVQMTIVNIDAKSRLHKSCLFMLLLAVTGSFLYQRFRSISPPNTTTCITIDLQSIQNKYIYTAHTYTYSTITPFLSHMSIIILVESSIVHMDITRKTHHVGSKQVYMTQAA